jgi:hypothetical protein
LKINKNSSLKEELSKIKKASHTLLKNFSILNFTGILAVIGLAQAWILTFYYQEKFNEWISWRSNDYSGKYFSIGQHYFSDYLHLNLDTRDGSVEYPLATYPPFANLIFRIFAYLPYKFSLALWLVCLVAAILLPLFYALYKIETEKKFQPILIYGLLSAPFIAVIDRGNSIGLITSLVFFSYIACERNKQITAGLLLGLAISLKIYPILLLPFLILKKKYKESISSILFVIILNILAALIWSHKSLIGTFVHQYKSLSAGNSIVKTGHGLNFSGGQILVNYFSKINVNAVDWLYNNTLGVSLVLLVFLIIGSFLSSHHTWLLYGLYSFQLIPSVSWSYTRIWGIVGIAILILSSTNFEKKGIWKSERFMWWTILIFNQSILTVLNFWPINLLPSISFLLCYSLIFYNLTKFSLFRIHNLSSRMKMFLQHN